MDKKSEAYLKIKAWAVLRESTLGPLIWLLIFLFLIPASCYWISQQGFPLPVLIFSFSGFFLVLLIQIFWLSRLLSSNNWVLRILPEGLLINPKGLAKKAQSSLLFIPRSAIRRVLTTTEILNIQKLRSRKSRINAYKFEYLELQVEKSKIEHFAPQGNFKKPVLQIGFIIQPVHEIEDGFRIEIQSHRTKLSPGLLKISNIFRIRWGINVKSIPQKNIEMNETTPEADFIRMVQELSRQNLKTEAIGAIHHRYKLNLKEAFSKFEDITKLSSFA